jgi:tetratricopeptide (TPR) repeat protein
MNLIDRSAVVGHRARTALRSAIVVAGLSLVTWEAGAQLAPKQVLAATAPTGCAAFAPATTPVSTSPLGEAGETRRLIDAGQEAALQGEHAAARDAFAQAVARSPGNALLAYYLGREHEALSQPTDAVREYCRYLQLAPGARDADEVRGRIVRLVPASELARMDEARANFRSGVTLLERRQYVAADSLFGNLTQHLPNAPELYFNRGLSRAARGERSLATEDFERYIELSGNPPDRTEIRSALLRLQDRIFSTGQALGAGLAFPGMGQMSTGRPVLGLLVLGAVVGASVWGLAEEQGVEVSSFTDPFGNTYLDSLPTTRQPNFGIAAAAVGVAWAGAAFEAMTYARRSRARAESIIRIGGSQVTDQPGAFLAVRRDRIALGFRLR